MIFVLMGVTGSGKTTVGKLLAARLHATFADADDYHSDANKQKMAAGIPLTDEDRAPWLRALNELLKQWQSDGADGVLACSALKQEYRTMLLDGVAKDAVHAILLDVSKDLLVARLAARKGHYMNPSLLDSQIATLQQPGDETTRIKNDGPPEEAVAAILKRLGGAEQTAGQ